MGPKEILEQLMAGNSVTLVFESRKSMMSFKASLATARLRLFKSFESLGIATDIQQKVICAEILSAHKNHIVVKFIFVDVDAYAAHQHKKRTYTILRIEEDGPDA